MRQIVILLAAALNLTSPVSVAESKSISAQQIITTCVQKGDAPCAVGVDQRTISINNITYGLTPAVLKELEDFYASKQQTLTAEEKKRFGILRDALQRMESKLGKVGEDIRDIKAQGEESVRLLKEATSPLLVVPGVIGKTLEQAKEVLYAKNMAVQVRSTTQESAMSALPDIVLEQAPAPGAKIDPRTTTIVLVVADGPTDPDAQFKLGLIYQDREKLYDKAANWYQKAADRGHVLAQYNLGHLYLSGKGVPADRNMSAKYWRMAAQQGLSQAQHSLGVLLLDGNVTADLRKEAISWLEKAAAQGFERSKTRLALIRLENAAERGNPEAIYQLGQMYLSGNGIKQDVRRAVALYKTAADQGYAPAQHEMGVFYEKGTVVPRNVTAAFDWYRKAAEQGNANAQNNLGTLYLEGRAVPQDVVLGIVWFKVAAAQGLELAKNNLNLAKQFSLSNSDIARINKLSESYYQKYVVKRR